MFEVPTPSPALPLGVEVSPLRRGRFRGGFIGAIFALFWIGLAQADESAPKFDQDQALQISQAAIGQELGDYRFLDGRGGIVELRQLRGRPLIINMVYTSCYHVCSTLTQQLARVVEIAQEALGADSFAVISIGFDTPNDTPDRMASYARARKVDLPNWRFLSADVPTIEQLTRDLGFVYFASAKGFDHTVQTTIVDSAGRVYKQVYGEAFPPPALIEPLKDLVFGRKAEASVLSNWIDNVRLICTVYDPSSGRYRFDYSIFIGAFVGVLCLGAAAVFIIHAWRDSVRPDKARPDKARPDPVVHDPKSDSIT